MLLTGLACAGCANVPGVRPHLNAATSSESLVSQALSQAKGEEVQPGSDVPKEHVPIEAVPEEQPPETEPGSHTRSPRETSPETGVSVPSPTFSASMAIALGDYVYETEGSTLDDDTIAALLRIRVEGTAPMERENLPAIGAGMSLEYTGTDDDLFEGRRSDAEILDASLYLLVKSPRSDDFRLSVRLGPYFHRLASGYPDSLDIVWESWGLRLGVEPEVLVPIEGDMELRLFLGLSTGIHITDAEVDVPRDHETFETDGYTFGVRLGAGVLVHEYSLGIAFLHQKVVMDDSDRKRGLSLRGIDATFRGIELSVGVQF
ncbi:MAG: hypothetical protein ACYTDY_05825 [Planctomycetota bacterium]|jgi:hypothetical protein